MIYYKSIDYINIYRFLLPAIIASFFFMQADAQRKTEVQHGNQERHAAPDRNREQRVQSPRQQYPAFNERPVSRRNHDFNKQEQINQPKPTQSRPRANDNTPTPRQNPGQQGANNNNDNNRFHPVQAANRPNHYWPHQTYSSSNPGWKYSHFPRRNTIITSFSFPYQTINYGGFGYRYCDGIYYRPYNNYYRVVGPPFGLFIDILPFGYRRVVWNDYPYYYYYGTYYDYYDNHYRVVAPPVGAIVESIPEGYETIVIDGETYYKVDDVQYKPVVQENGEIWYQVIKVG